MIEWLKMCATGKSFGKISLKAIIRNTFSPICDEGKGRVIQFFWCRWYPAEGGSSNFWVCRESPPRSPSLSGKSWSSHKETPEEGVCSPYSNVFEKSE